jgi:outer membrane lipoprotein-sorting protein
MNTPIRSLLIIIALFAVAPAATAAPDPTQLVKGALHRWRGDSSYTEVAMTIHRPDWQRDMTMVSWTRGKSDSLVRFTQPPGDAGNATLKLGQALWLFNPKLNQVIRLPFSMMAQNWMGSDFTYNDFVKSDQIVNDYTQRLDASESRDGHKVYTVTCLPKPDAAVVWGKQVLKIRDDHVLLEETFFDQDMKPVRRLRTTKIAPLGGRPYPVVMRVAKIATPERWTEMRYVRAVFDLKLPGYLFTQSNLRNPRPWRAP